MSFSIFTDTSANLPSKLLKKLGVLVVPFSYYINEKEYNCLDTELFEGSKYYDDMRNGVNITTSQINPQAYIDYLTPANF